MFKLSVISPTASYDLAANVGQMDEGAQNVITLTTAGVQNGQTLPYTISGTGITLDDFTNIASLTGNFTIQGGLAYLNVTTKKDITLEGLETFTVTLDDSLEAISVDINDTSFSAVWDAGAAVWDNSLTFWDVVGAPQ